jgi:putative PIN family toxin of toxin-antitoxin system
MPKQRKIRLILDTNWYISATINAKSRRTFYETIIKSERFKVYYSDELVSEYLEVMSRKKFVKYIKPDQLKRLMGFFFPKLIKTKPLHFTGVRDPKDNYLIGMCMSCKPDFLVTGDDDLLSMGVFEGTTILAMRQFLQILPLLM